VTDRIEEQAYRWQRTFLFAATLALVISLSILLWLLV
jgi:hypothetical protein